MNLSPWSAYALHALVFLARQDTAPVIPAHELARACGNPDLCLLPALKRLAAAGVLHAVKGPHGGYRLARPPEDISVLEVVEALTGPLRAGAPSSKRATFKKADAVLDQRLQALCEDVARRVRRVLEGVTLADLATEKPAGKKGTRQKGGGA
jgi:Rrf2 family protein